MIYGSQLRLEKFLLRAVGISFENYVKYRLRIMSNEFFFFRIKEIKILYQLTCWSMSKKELSSLLGLVESLMCLSQESAF